MLYRSPDLLPQSFSNPSVFLAGGISNCPDWQQELIPLMDCEKHDVVNPRRDGGFDRTGAMARDQIAWEYHALSMVDSCTFWFPKETLCPITLFELGKMLERTMQHRRMRLVIGWHPKYERAFDLEIQIMLANHHPGRIIHAGPGWEKFCEVISKVWG